MPPELARLLHEAAPQPSHGLDPDQMWSAGRRRRRQRQVVLGVAVIALAGLAAAGTSWLTRPESQSDRLVTAGGDLVTYDDPVHDFTVHYPAGWRRASTSLTPNLSDPVEILSVGTAELPAGGESCAQFPVAALEAMSTTDAFVTVQERRQGDASFPPRPQQLPPNGSKNTSEVVDCLAGPAVFDHWWFAFEDAGRYFHVLVAIGTDASERTRADAWQTLESLQFDSQPQVAVPVPAVEGLTLAQAMAALQEAGLRAGPAEGDPTEPDAVVVAQEPSADSQISDDAVGLRTALVTPELCEVLRRLPDFSDGGRWDLPINVLEDVANLADPALRNDTQLVIGHITSGNDTPDDAAMRALDRLVIHRRACD